MRFEQAIANQIPIIPMRPFDTYKFARRARNVIMHNLVLLRCPDHGVDLSSKEFLTHPPYGYLTSMAAFRVGEERQLLSEERLYTTLYRELQGRVPDDTVDMIYGELEKKGLTVTREDDIRERLQAFYISFCKICSEGRMDLRKLQLLIINFAITPPVIQPVEIISVPVMH